LGETYTALSYADWIKPQTAKVMATYDQPELKDFAAVTRNQFGKGVAWYVGTIVGEPRFYDELMSAILNDARIKRIPEPPEGVEVGTRENAEYELLFFINHTERAKVLDFPGEGQELLTNKPAGKSIQLEPFGVSVIKRPRAAAK
jgi:beta-galactosidase